MGGGPSFHSYGKTVLNSDPGNIGIVYGTPSYYTLDNCQQISGYGLNNTPVPSGTLMWVNGMYYNTQNQIYIWNNIYTDLTSNPLPEAYGYKVINPTAQASFIQPEYVPGQNLIFDMFTAQVGPNQLTSNKFTNTWDSLLQSYYENFNPKNPPPGGIGPGGPPGP